MGQTQLPQPSTVQHNTEINEAANAAGAFTSLASLLQKLEQAIATKQTELEGYVTSARNSATQAEMYKNEALKAKHAITADSAQIYRDLLNDCGCNPKPKPVYSDVQPV